MTISDEAKAIYILHEEKAQILAKAESLNKEIMKVHEDYIKHLRRLSNTHEYYLEKIKSCDKVIYETTKLLCQSSNTYSPKG